jgi:hypothetical protein
LFAAGALRASDLRSLAHHEFFVVRTAVIALIFVDRHIYILARRKFGVCAESWGSDPRFAHIGP